MLSNRPHLNLSDEIQFGEPVLKAHGGFCDQLAKEIRVWSGLYHRNVLPLLGYVIEGEYPSLISEWMENGTVSRYMRKHPKTDLLQMILGIARGLEYIHGQGVIHSDIKASFGETSAHRVKGTVRWMARELLEDPQAVHSKESDIWAFGMTIYVRTSQNLQLHFFTVLPFRSSSPIKFLFTIYHATCTLCSLYCKAILRHSPDPFPVGQFIGKNFGVSVLSRGTGTLNFVNLCLRSCGTWNCYVVTRKKNATASQSSLRAFESPEIPVCRQASVLGEDGYELPTEEPHDSRIFCSSKSRLRSDAARPEGNEILHGHSEQSFLDGHDYFTAPFFREELRNADTLNSRPNRPRTPSLGKRNIIRDFDLRQSSASYARKVDLYALFALVRETGSVRRSRLSI
ncbi:kinase-like protein [Sanghuangporus baumii]|uniref:Kinase-like protein n=1 Tax=Sanghuangporus baumii TaxID=108892 RepID=A0A9Q5I5A2_SANBA|nr:kinase-like protein [Sanghuangporus baumii]